MMPQKRRSSFDRKLDRIRDREERQQNKTRIKNRFVRKFLGNRLAVAGVVVLTIIGVMVFFAPLFTKYVPLETVLTQENYLKPPSAEHIFGTNKNGRDIYASILYGGRISILVGLGSALGAALIGVTIGCYTGYVGGFIDKGVMRLSEIMMAFPRIILVMLLITILGRSMWNLIGIFILTGWTSIFRLTRAQMLSLREEEYVQALRAFGLPRFLIAFKHILPNALGPIMVNITLSTAAFILQEAALSFLGMGVPLNIPTWGNLLNAAKSVDVLRNNWWTWLPVGLTLSLFILSINFIGDGFSESADPAGSS